VKVIIGLEQHLQLNTRAKLFCECPTEKYLEAESNSLVCPTCTSQPGSKPYGINEEALAKVLKIALALNCKVNVGKPIFMQRKHYFYPDLPSNYQRTSKPIAEKGELAGVRIREVHLEEDPGRYDLKSGTVDYNRCGIPLIEIVTEPDITSPENAREFLDELQAIMNYLDVAREEPGSTRVDANISFEGHNRVEVKNINSFKGVLTALTYEITRQKNLLKHRQEIIQETRHFDEAQGTTIGLRKKETVADYRYFPDPDVPPMVISDAFVEMVRNELPELPRQKMQRFMKQYKLAKEEAFVLTLERDFADAFETVARQAKPKDAAQFMRGVLRKQLNYRSMKLADSGITLEDLVELLGMLEKKRITVKAAEKLLILMLDEKKKLRELPVFEEFVGIEKEHVVEHAVMEAIQENPKAIEDYKKGGEKAFHFIFGKVMKKTRGKADPANVRALLKKYLNV
jgi:aspartyl-tRNA(Asn)/glutamyl-tRNA(Gln) amidotransferase subunit B